MTRYLTTEDLLALCDVAGLGPIRDLGLLDSAAHRPQATVLGRDAYPSLALKAAALAESVGRNHGLVDGNKRLTWLALRTFLLLNGYDVQWSIDDAYAYVMDVCTGVIDVPRSAELLAAVLREAPPGRRSG